MSSLQRISESFNDSVRNVRNYISFGNLINRLTNTYNNRCTSRRSSRRRHRLRESTRNVINGHRRDDEEDFFRQYFGTRGHSSRSHLNNSGVKEKNILSAILSILVIATIATAIVQPKWFSIRGGICSRKFIGLQEFIALSYIRENSFNLAKDTATLKPNNFYEIPNNLFPSAKVAYKDSRITKQSFEKDNKLTTPSSKTTSPSLTLPSPLPLQKPRLLPFRQMSPSKLPVNSFLFFGSNSEPKNCITPEIACLQRTIIALCLVVILFNLLQFFLDTIGTKISWLNLLRRNAIGSICGVFFTIVIIGIAYIVSTLLEKEQKRLLESGTNFTNNSIIIEIRFEISYYLITLAGLLGLIGSSFNLFRNPVQYYSNSPLSPVSSRSSDSHNNSTNTSIREEDNYFSDQTFGYSSLTSRCTPTVTACVPSIAIPPPPYVP